MSPASVESLLVLALGFAVAACLATGYQLVMAEPARFGLLQRGPRFDMVLTLPFLIFAAPFIIMRNTLRAVAAQQRKFVPAFCATVIASFWSLMSGTLVVMALQAFGLLNL